MPVVGTLKLKTRSSESGMPESQAQVLVEELDEVLSTAIAREAATKSDVVELRAAIEGLEERFDQRLEQVDRRLDEMKADNGKRLDEMKVDNSKRLDEMKVDNSKRLDALQADNDNRLDEMKADYGKRLDALQAEINDMKAEIKLLRWMVGAILTIVAGIGIRLLFM